MHFIDTIYCRRLQEQKRDSMSDSNNLSLSQAMKDGRLQDFIAQEEGRGVGPADEKTVMEALSLTIKPHQSEGQNRVLHVAMVRAESEFVQVTLHVFLKHMNVRTAHPCQGACHQHRPHQVQRGLATWRSLPHSPSICGYAGPTPSTYACYPQADPA